jgi:hypothetical protein
MYHQLCYHSALIIVLLNLYCYASPIDQNQYSHIMEPNVSITNSAIPSRQILNEIHRFKILCSFYGDCNDEDNRKIMDYDDTKQKRLSSNLFHGIPKFGKRAFASAFAGIPKFG